MRDAHLHLLEKTPAHTISWLNNIINHVNTQNIFSSKRVSIFCKLQYVNLPYGEGNMSLLGGWGIPQDILILHVLRLNLALSKVQNCYAKNMLWKVC